MIFRILVQKNDSWHELDLPKDFNLSMVLNSGFLGSKQSGSFSFTNTLPTTPNNCTILQNAQFPQVVTDRKIQFPAKLLVGSTELYSWYFVLRKAGQKSYSYDLIQTPGNQSRYFYEQKLWQLDFGKLEMQSTLKQSNILTIDLYGPSKLHEKFISPDAIYFEIVIDNVVIAHPIVGMQNEDSLNYWYLERDPEKRFLLVTKGITTYFITLDIPKAGAGSINIISNSNPIGSAKIKLYGITINTFIQKGAFIAEYNFTKLSFQDVSESLNTIAKNPINYPFRFLTYFNDGYYPSDNTNFEGIVNQYNEDGSLVLNDGYTYLNTYPISPCFSMIFILEKIATMMGYTLKADIFKEKALAGDDYLGDLYIINNKDLAEQMKNTTIQCNTYGTIINYAYFMPDMTVKEFIDAIRTTFCLSVEYDFLSSTMTVKRCKETLVDGHVIDISTRLYPFPMAEINDKSYFQLGFKNADTNVISQKNYPADETIAEDGNNYTKIEAGFTPVINNLDLDPFAVYDPNPNIPTANDTARTVIYLDQKNNHPTPKICFYLGNGSNGLRWIAKSDNKNTKLCLSWQSTNTHKGLLEAFYQEYLDFLNNAVQWSTEIWLTELELANFKFAQKYYAYGTVFLTETLNPKLPIKDMTPIKLLSL